MLDEELLGADPEYLPRRLLHNFSIYNAEVGHDGVQVTGVGHDGGKGADVGQGGV
jgi:hypothetical protein